MVETLARWWSRKFSLPWNHDLFQERLIFDLMVEYWLDVFDEKPLEVHRNADGFVQLKDTGDPVIDRWEQQIANGESPDLYETFAPEEQAKLRDIEAKSMAALRDKKMRQKAMGATGMSMKDAMDNLERDARSQGLDLPNTAQRGPRRNFGTFGNGSE